MDLISFVNVVYLRTQGATKGHPVRKELQRVKEYMDKIDKLSAANKGNISLDKYAAKRFIKHTLSSNAEIKEKYNVQEQEEYAKSFLDSIIANASESSVKAKNARSDKNSDATNILTDKRKADDESSASTPSKPPSKKSKKRNH
ncbi:hypothetical protein HK100_000254 [Physocladia obscura]|uniref:Exosome complex protein n=1 Tax=Physocladia obscura TaxID=109957 RepID=A0AAD5T169_9FUNG|nr:hypothetical protein HK100_000254 [Physocladia obscura]